MNTIIVLGSANMDLVVRQPRLPAPGETLFGSGFSTVPGGKGLNQAVAAARLGGDVGFVGAVGDDRYGRAIRDLLAAEGIDTVGLAVVEDTATGTAHISVVDSGENSIVVVSGANATVTALAEEQRAAIRSAKYLVMQCELPVAVLEEAAVIAREAGVFTILTPAPVVDLPAGFLESIDLVVPNQIEAAALTGLADAQAQAAALSANRWAIVTLGEEGAIIAQNSQVLGIAPARPVTAVDTTAAGDTFVGALTVRLAAGDDMVQALRWATAAASLTVTRAGATASMPTQHEVQQILL